MKRICILLTVAIASIFYTEAGNLTTTQIVNLANSNSISSISSLATSNGYKLAYKRNGANGYEGYNVTDIAWAYNATYIPSVNGWDYSGSFSAIKLLYNNTTKNQKP